MKRRLAGAGVLLGATFILSLLLPKPDVSEPDDGKIKRVTIDLTQTSVTAPAPVTASSALPPVIVSPQKAAASAETLASSLAEKSAAPAPQEPLIETPVQEETHPEPPAPESREPQKAVAERPKTDAPIPRKLDVKPPLKPQAAKTQWFVQIGSFTEIANARQALDKLKPAKGVIAPADTAAGTRYRVRLGPYAGKEQAGAMRDKLAQQGYAQAAVIED